MKREREIGRREGFVVQVRMSARGHTRRTRRKRSVTNGHALLRLHTTHAQSQNQLDKKKRRRKRLTPGRAAMLK